MPNFIVNDVAPRVQYAANGTNTTFTFPFPVIDAADLKVWFDDGNAAGSYTVSGLSQTAGGEVHFAAAPPNGTRVTILRDMPVRRTTDFQEAGEFRAAAINDELDRLAMMVQQVEHKVDRAAALAPTAQPASVRLPDPVGDGFVRWNTAATALVNDLTLPAAVATSAANAAAAQSSATSASISATGAATNASAAATSATSAATSASGASTSASNAATSAANAAASATSASSSATTATTQATNAATSATTASNAATTATTQASNASASASGAATSATNAAASATSAATSASSAATSATNAATSAAAAAANTAQYVVAAGSGETMTLAPSTAWTSYVDGAELRVLTPAGANTSTAPTANVSSLGAKTVKKADGASVAVADIPASTEITLRYHASSDCLRMVYQPVASGGYSVGGQTAGGAIALADYVGSNISSAEKKTQLIDLAKGFGKILQIVHAEKTSAVSIASTSETDFSGISVSITPKRSDSTILLLAFIDLSVIFNGGGGTDEARWCRVKWTNNANANPNVAYEIAKSYWAFRTNTGGSAAGGGQAVFGMDAPGTTSAQTYKLRGWLNSTAGSSTADINSGAGGADGRSILMAIEVANLS